MSEDQKHQFEFFIAGSVGVAYTGELTLEGKSVLYALLRFFLSYPDMEFAGSFLRDDGSGVHALHTWVDLWNFTINQMMKNHMKDIDWGDGCFPEIKNKETSKTVCRKDYQEAVKNWFKDDNDALRNGNRKALEDRCKMFLETLRGFTDWNTEGGTIKDWEDYQLKRWEAYKDLTNEDLPESLTTLKAVREAEKSKIENEK